MGACFAQNAKTVEDYEASIRSGRFATQRGLRATREDLLRRAVIMALMCQGRVEFDDVDAAHLVDARSHFAAELSRLQPFQAEGLVEVDDRGIRVTPLGWFFVRGVAMVFDQHLQAQFDRARFSRII
jgi:oxygen-independent coproporphyrinogen-3 oxidase